MMYEPIKLTPFYREALWGGGRLRHEFGRIDAPEVTAESWELALHKAGSSRIAEGPLAGQTLDALDRESCWGRKCMGKDFPLLVKLIDANHTLSVQVHPSDETALPELGEQGKAELWYVVDRRPGAFLYLGFSRRVDRAEFLRRAQDGSICEVLNRVPVSRGDVFYIRPGTIHAIGQGCLIAEIQQNSNTTFRAYDYQRRDAQGKLRELHLERASDVVSYEPILPQECRTNRSVLTSEFELREMFSGPCFTACCLDVFSAVELRCDGESFHHLLCVEGEGEITCGGKRCPLRKGDSYFMPACLGVYRVEGRCRALLSYV